MKSVWVSIILAASLGFPAGAKEKPKQTNDVEKADFKLPEVEIPAAATDLRGYAGFVHKASKGSPPKGCVQMTLDMVSEFREPAGKCTKVPNGQAKHQKRKAGHYHACTSASGDEYYFLPTKDECLLMQKQLTE